MAIDLLKYYIRLDAAATVNKAVLIGIITPARKQECLDCHKQARELHHHLGYSEYFWLSVIPLCRKCHCRRHKYAAISIGPRLQNELFYSTDIPNGVKA